MKEIIIPYKDLLPDGCQTELRAQRNSTRKVSMLQGNLVGNSRADGAGVSARVCKNGVYGFASEADLSADAAGRVLRSAADNAIFMDGRIGKGLAARPVIPYANIDSGITYSDTEQKEFIEFMKEIDEYIASKEKLISRRVIIFTESREKYLITSDGAEASLCIPRSYVNFLMTAEGPDGSPIDMYSPIGGFGNFKERFKDPSALFPAIDRCHKKLMDKCSGVYAEAGLKTVIIGGSLGGMLAHEAVGHTVEADLVIGGSVAGKNLGREVASPLVSLTDFANTAFGKQVPLPVFADDEGTPAVDAPIIKDGILVGYMHNRETAQRFGVAPCGNARAFAYNDEPLIRMRNTAIHPGKDKIEDMIASVDDGYYLIDTGNGQADNTGEFMFGITMGYEIKHGKLGRAILDTTISGVAFEMLKTVDMVSDKISWEDCGYCGKKQPMPVGLGGPELRCKVMMGGR